MIYQKVSSLNNTNLSPVGDHIPCGCLPPSVKPEDQQLSDLLSAAEPHSAWGWKVSSKNLYKLD